MRVNGDYETWNAAAQVKDPDSVRSFWKEALQRRKKHDVLVRLSLHASPRLITIAASLQIYGDFVDISPQDEQVFAYIRTLGNVSILSVLNFTVDEVDFELDKGWDWGGFQLELGNYHQEVAPSGLQLTGGGIIALKGYEGRLYIRI